MADRRECYDVTCYLWQWTIQALYILFKEKNKNLRGPGHRVQSITVNYSRQ